jgi:molybdenum cofactor sulfurtransferase
VDYTGAALHSEKRVAEYVANCLMAPLPGSFRRTGVAVRANPHSQNAASQAASADVAAARELVLRHFGVSEREYAVVFTSGATAALRLVSSAFFGGSHGDCSRDAFVYARDSHTSVVGMREDAYSAGAQVCVLPSAEDNLRHFDAALTNEGRTLVALTGESNYAGAKLDAAHLAQWCTRARKTRDASGGRSFVVLDAAALVANSSLDLSRLGPDYMAISFYKIFGYPTGLGALLVRLGDAVRELTEGKTYFGGGTVAAVTATLRFHAKRPDVAMALEDGTVDFLGIPALRYGFAFVNDDLGGMDAVERHAMSLASRFYSALSALSHGNGAPVARVYGNWSRLKRVSDETDTGEQWKESARIQGPIVTFSLLKPDGSFVGHYVVDQLASLNGIMLRSGCFCNPGACADSLELDDTTLKGNYDTGSHVCWDDNDIVNGRPTGAVRVSFGAANVPDDVDTIVCFIEEHFVVGNALPEAPEDVNTTDSGGIVDEIRIFPIKSAGAHVVRGLRQSWPITDTGFMFDREWVVVRHVSRADGTERILDVNQKTHARMGLIRPVIDLENRRLRVSSPHCSTPLEIALDGVPDMTPDSERSLQFAVCGSFTTGDCYPPGVDAWFSSAVGTPVRLLRRSTNEDSARLCNLRLRDADTCKIAFSNESQFLVVTTESVAAIRREVEKSDDPCADLTPATFRPNIVLRGQEGQRAYREDSWSAIRVGQTDFRISGQCNRCKMVCIDQETAEERVEPLKTLARVRRSRTGARIWFGVHAQHDATSSASVTIGDEVRVLETTQRAL